MANKLGAILQDSGVERAVLASITTYGIECFFNIEEIIDVSDFYWTYNQKLFKILSHLAHNQNTQIFDIPSIQAVAKIFGYDDFTNGGKYQEYLESIVEEVGPTIENVKSLALIVYKLSIARCGYKVTKTVQNNLAKITGNEKIDDIINDIECPVMEFTSKLMSQGAGLISLGNNFSDVMKILEQNTKDIVGLPTGFSAWDHAIGGGLRPATVNVIGARAKGAKSFFCLNVAKNVAENGIPVLYLDSELTSDTQIHRLTSLVSGIELQRIENGKFKSDKNETNAIWGCRKYIENLCIDHFSVVGLSPQAIISVARRWLSKTVGFTDSGRAKPCLIIYDYIKLMDDDGFKNNLQEYQLLGFLTTALHNFATKFYLPILATVQLNRDGTTKEGAEVISGSDRILWLCSSFTILKQKTSSELNEDPPSNGTKKLTGIVTRFGPGMENGEYINIMSDLKIGKLEEGQLFSAVLKNSFINLSKNV